MTVYEDIEESMQNIRDCLCPETLSDIEHTHDHIDQIAYCVKELNSLVESLEERVSILESK